MKADGNWLYIILSIVFLVLSAIGNKGKKKATTSTPPINDDDDFEPIPSHPKPQHHTQQNKPRSLGDILNEVLEIPREPEVVVEKPRPWERETVLESTQNSYEKIEDEAKSLESIESETFTYDAPEEILKVQRKEHVEPIFTERKEETEPVLALNNLDLRQGIIYAEILNRKYF